MDNALLRNAPTRNALSNINRQYSQMGQSSAAIVPNYGKRPDGTMKGRGFLGELKRPDGGVSTEISVGVNIGGKEMDIPTLVPTLSQDEVNYLLSGKPPTRQIVDKAVRHAIDRMGSGLPVFAE